MSTRQSNRSSNVPSTPRVISPSPTPSESGRRSGDEDYFGPVTRSAARRRVTSPPPISEDVDEEDAEDDISAADDDSESSAELRRARAKSRDKRTKRSSKAVEASSGGLKPLTITSNGKSSATNGHLSPTSAGWSWRDISRSPSPLGLIPIHRKWRSMVHRHEIPRKVLHVSIGFVVIYFYVTGVQTNAITPYLMGALIPIASIDYLRFKYPSLNSMYVRVVGAFMRETEFNGWNGVIWYLLGAWFVLSFFPKDVAVVSVMLLSWCDTAASTFGRAYGRYTPLIRKGKSLAGSLAAFGVGLATAAAFWGWLAPRTGPFPDDAAWPFMFTGTLSLPSSVRNLLQLSQNQASISGNLALGVMSVVTGFIAAASEVANLFGLDDNLTIPVLSGVGIWGFLKVFG